jgi:hypothetical protein
MRGGRTATGRARLLEGWQLGLLAVGLPLLALWLALPRPVAPKTVPLPELDRRLLRRGLEADRVRADAALRERLPFAARQVGELMRRFGAADANEGARLRREIARAFRQALGEVSARPLLELRAVQTRLFVAAVERWQTRGQTDRELLELAGNFAEKCRAASWLDAEGRIVFTPAELHVLYRIRWTELAGALEDAEFRPSLTDLRLYYRALLEHPEGTSASERDAARLAYVAALSRKDPEYPGDLARGVLLFRLGQHEAAASALTLHLTSHPDGPHALTARNYLLAALAGGPAPE